MVLGAAVVDVAVVLVAAGGDGVVLLDGAALVDGDGDTGGVDVVVDALGGAAVVAEGGGGLVGAGNGAGGDADGAGGGGAGAGAGWVVDVLIGGGVVRGTVVVGMVAVVFSGTTEGPGAADDNNAGALVVLRGAVVLCVVVAAGMCPTGNAPCTLAA